MDFTTPHHLLPSSSSSPPPPPPPPPSSPNKVNLDTVMSESLAVQPSPLMDAEYWQGPVDHEMRVNALHLIMATLTNNRPNLGEEVLQKFRSTTVTFEGKVYAVAKNRSDYMRMVSYRMNQFVQQQQSMGPRLEIPMLNRNDPNPNCTLEIPMLNRNAPCLSQKLEAQLELMAGKLEGVSMGKAAMSEGYLDIINSEPNQAKKSPASVDSEDWRSCVNPNIRTGVLDKMLKTVTSFPTTDEEVLRKRISIVTRFEELVYRTARSMDDYMGQIVSEMIPIMEPEPVRPSVFVMKKVNNNTPKPSYRMQYLKPNSYTPFPNCGSPTPSSNSSTTSPKPVPKTLAQLELMVGKIEENMCEEAMSQPEHLQKIEILKNAVDDVKGSGNTA